MKEYRFLEPHYQANVCVLVGGTPADVRKLLERRHGKNFKMYSQGEEVDDDNRDSDDAFQFTVHEKEEIFYIWLDRVDLELLYHEIFHLTFDVLVSRGIAYDSSCEEAFAYWGAKVFIKFAKKLKLVKKI